MLDGGGGGAGGDAVGDGGARKGPNYGNGLELGERRQVLQPPVVYLNETRAGRR